MLMGPFVACCVLAGSAWAQNQPVDSYLRKTLPGRLEWKHSPVRVEVHGGVLTIAAGPATDWFISPVDGGTKANAPILLFQPAEDFILTAKITADLPTKWDAGMLMVYLDDSNWAKFAFEMSAYNEPTIVTVVTRGVSDDCNSSSVSGNSVWFRIARTGRAIVFYASPDGKSWKMVRTFTFGPAPHLRVGFGSQSPVGPGATASFSDIRYTAGKVKDLFRGE